MDELFRQYILVRELRVYKIYFVWPPMICEVDWSLQIQKIDSLDS